MTRLQLAVVCHIRRFAWAYWPVYAIVVGFLLANAVALTSLLDIIILTAFCVVVTYSELLRWTC